MANAKENAGKVLFCLCGPIGSLCCFILSIWGIVMLTLLGGFYYIESAVLFEDFHASIHHSHDGDIKGVYYYDTSDVTSAYHNAAYTCWGAAVIYVFFLILSGSFIGVNVWRKRNQAAE